MTKTGSRRKSKPSRDDSHPDKRIGLIAGNGQFPILFSEAARKNGFSVYAAAYVGEADAELEDRVAGIRWLHLGQLKRLLRFFQSHGVTEVVIAGGVTKTKMFSDVKPDIKAISLMFKVKHTHDDHVLKTFADWLEKEGITVRQATFLMPELIAVEGCWTRRKPTKAESADIELGWQLAKEIGKLDIGQCIVLGGGSVLAVEAIDGTDATIKRGGQLGQGNAVVVKICKPDQDRRFDMPAVGKQSIKTMMAAGAKVLALEAGRTIVFDREEMIAMADEAGIAIVARQ
jgi:UDP-2,3-diacylglucosamine hydrolase